MNSADIPIKVINLRKSADRRATFSRVNSHVDFEFFEAVEGNTLARERIEDPSLFIQPLPFPSLGAFGCALSHLALWDLAIEKNHAVTVAEDDTVFRRDFREQSAAVIARMPPDWDIIVWGWNFDFVVSLMSLAGVTPAVLFCNQEMLRENIDTFQASTGPCYPLPLDRTLGTPGYTISAAGARKFRQECFPMKDFELYFPGVDRSVNVTGIDVAMARTYSLTQSFVAFPPLIATKNEIEHSTVQIAEANAARQLPRQGDGPTVG